jgi:hypothetical protein
LFVLFEVLVLSLCDCDSELENALLYDVDQWIAPRAAAPSCALTLRRLSQRP